MLLIKVPAEQSAADAAGNRSNRPSPQRITDQGTPNTTSDCPDRAVTATTTMTIIAAAAVIDMVVSLIC